MLASFDNYGHLPGNFVEGFTALQHVSAIRYVRLRPSYLVVGPFDTGDN